MGALLRQLNQSESHDNEVTLVYACLAELKIVHSLSVRIAVSRYYYSSLGLRDEFQWEGSKSFKSN